MSEPIVEICVDDPWGLQSAIAGGADRIELCAALGVGGLTPSVGFMTKAAQCPLPVYAMIRPRAGDFVFTPDELAVMLDDIDVVREAGLAGVVLGASRSDGSLDTESLEILVARAQGLGLTLHRAFDLVPDVFKAVDAAADLGFERILTSGGAPTAIEGIQALKRIVSHAADRIAIMAGSGVTSANIGQLCKALGLKEFHASASVPVEVPRGRVAQLGYVTEGMKRTDARTVSALKTALAAAR